METSPGYQTVPERAALNGCTVSSFRSFRTTVLIRIVVRSVPSSLRRKSAGESLRLGLTAAAAAGIRAAYILAGRSLITWTTVLASAVTPVIMTRAGTLSESLVSAAAAVVGIILHGELCDEIER